MIKIIAIGKIKENYFKDAQQEYLKRLQKYQKVEIIELFDVKDNDKAHALTKEKELIKEHLKPKDNIIVLDINSEEYNSIAFSKLINDELTYKSNITFIIGSSNGLDEEIKMLANKKVSFSKLTFPHQLFRVILLEQLYRSFKIINNETYHK